jgi:NAD(P)-dependent dehydrogenase (short-subunit alcohol dehydrogenase family)
MRFQGKTAVLAAGANAIGRACARKLAAEGCSVIIVDNRPFDLDEVERRGVDCAANLKVVNADATDPDVMAEVAEACGKVDILLNLHYSHSWKSLAESSLTDWIADLQVNLLGPVVCSKALLPLLRCSPSAAIVHLGSIDGALGNPGVPLYSTSKAGLIALTHVMAHEFGEYGIRVNCVARAAISEDALPLAVAARMQHAIAVTPLRRVARAEEVADATLYLASDAASFITGAVLPVDGGRSGLTPGTLS